MTIEEIYQTIFPISGGVDNNNRYIDMKTSDLQMVQMLEPTVGVSEFIITNKERQIANALPDRMAFRLPLVSVNDYMLDNKTITDFYLDYSGFVPTCMVEFVDMNNNMLSVNSLRDGSIIKVYIGGQGDELYYKPIRQDFIVTNIAKLNSGTQNHGDWLQYRLTGILNVPMGNRKDSWSNNDASSMQELFNLAVYTGLGFQTNFTFETIDKMRWINTLGGTFFEFMENIANHACYSPNTFFTAFVDQYYVLNFIECHSLLSHGGLKTDTPMMIYNNIQDDREPNVDKSKNDGKNKETKDQIDVPKGQDDLMNVDQKLSYYFLTNFNYFNGWTNFIESYNEISDGYASMDEGYRKHLVYSDSNTCGWGSNGEFIIRPIDNLKRDDASQQIQPLGELDQNTYLPINLMQTNNPDYLNDKGAFSNVDKMSDVESYVNLGEVDTSNMFKQYYFAEVQNSYQMSCMKKCGLRVTLQNYNPAITKFSRIWVDLYDMNTMSSQSIKPEKNIRKSSNTGNIDENPWLQYKQQKNDNIINYPDEGMFSTGKKIRDENGNEVEDPGKNTNSPRGNYNRSLSGWYVVTEMKITYDNYDKNLKSHLLLNRIEYRPLFKHDYNLAKEAIDKYKEEHKPECIFGSIDDFSYSETNSDKEETTATDKDKEETTDKPNDSTTDSSTGSDDNNQGTGGNQQGGENSGGNTEGNGGNNQQGGENNSGNTGDNNNQQGEGNGDNNQQDGENTGEGNGDNNEEDNKPNPEEEGYDYDEFVKNYYKIVDLIKKEDLISGYKSSVYCENVIKKEYEVKSVDTGNARYGHLNPSYLHESITIQFETKKNDIRKIEFIYKKDDERKEVTAIQLDFKCAQGHLQKLLDAPNLRRYTKKADGLYLVGPSVLNYDRYAFIVENTFGHTILFYIPY